MDKREVLELLRGYVSGRMDSVEALREIDRQLAAQPDAVQRAMRERMLHGGWADCDARIRDAALEEAAQKFDELGGWSISAQMVRSLKSNTAPAGGTSTAGESTDPTRPTRADQSGAGADSPAPALCAVCRHAKEKHGIGGCYGNGSCYCFRFEEPAGGAGSTPMASREPLTASPAPAEPMGRVETGVVRFEDDWPGVFLRGDYALPCAHALSLHLKRHGGSPFTPGLLEGLAEILASCDQRLNPTAREVYRRAAPTPTAEQVVDAVGKEARRRGWNEGTFRAVTADAIRALYTPKETPHA